METNNNSLPVGSILRSSDMTYTIERVLGRGGFGITYLAVTTIRIGNINQEIRFAIKEHFVSSLCSRGQDNLRVEFSEPVAETVLSNRNAFLTEARRLQHLGIEHPNIVHINEVFESNNTAYYVMEYLGDNSLKEYVEKKGKLSLDETSKIMRPVMEAVGVMHRNRLAHYDIKPGNIMMHRLSDNSLRPVLIDFGLSKHYDDEGQPTSQLSDSGYTAGYAPAQQYVGLSSFSPRCDVYALAATTYFCLTGNKPPEALSVRPENIISTLKPIVGELAAQAVAHGMAMLEDDRTADAYTLRKEIFGDCEPQPINEKSKTAKIDPLSIRTINTKKNTNIPQNSRRRISPWVWITICIATLGAAGAAYFLFNKDNDSVRSHTSSDAESGDVEESATDITEVEIEPQIEDPSIDSRDLISDEQSPQTAQQPKITPSTDTHTNPTVNVKPEPDISDVIESVPDIPRTVKCQPVKVNVTSGWTAPVYDTGLKSANAGSITFDVTFDKNGIPTNIKTVGGSTLDSNIQAKCKAMVRAGRFTFKDGKSNLGGSARVTFHFMP